MDYMAILQWLMQAIQQQGRQSRAGPMGYADPAAEQQRLRQMTSGTQGFEDRGAMQDRLRQSRGAPGGPRRPMDMDPGYGGWSKPFMGGGQTPQLERPMYGGSFDPLAEQERLRGMANAGPLPAPPPPSGQDWINPSAFAGWQPPAKQNTDFSGMGGWSVSEALGGSGGSVSRDLDPWKPLENTA